MKIACASDAHGARDSMQRLIRTLPKVDAFCFLGDCDADADFLELLLKDAQPNAAFIAVAGNNDLASQRAGTIEMYFDETRALITHGHLFRVKLSMLPLLYRARERACALVLFGHTHCPCDETSDGVRLVNPGALNRGQWALIETGEEIRVQLLLVR